MKCTSTNVLAAVRMDKSTAHPSIIIEDGGTKLTIDATKQNYASMSHVLRLQTQLIQLQ